MISLKNAISRVKVRGTGRVRIHVKNGDERWEHGSVSGSRLGLGFRVQPLSPSMYSGLFTLNPLREGEGSGLGLELRLGLVDIGVAAGDMVDDGRDALLGGPSGYDQVEL